MIPKIKFVFDRHKRASDTKKGVIEIRITVAKTQKFISTGIACYREQWDEKHENVINTIDSMMLNEIIMKMRLKAIKAINKQLENDSFDINEIASALRTKNKTQMTFIGYIKKRIEEKPVSDYTKKAYNVFLSRFEEWGKMAFFSDINEKNIRAWDEWLHNVRWTVKDKYNKDIEKKYSQATIGSMHKNLKAFINDAMVDGHLKQNPYSAKRIRIDKGTTRIDHFLTKQEIERIEKAKMPTRSLMEARDLFLIQVYTGLSYVDLMNYDFTQCKNANDYAVFSGIRSKTGTVFTFVLTPKAKEILQRYKYVMPKLPNQKYNVKLKLIADAAGIDKNVTTHDARRSCGYLLLNAGVPIAVVSRCLGHSSIRQTEQAYARLLDDTIANEIKKHMK